MIRTAHRLGWHRWCRGMSFCWPARTEPGYTRWRLRCLVNDLRVFRFWDLARFWLGIPLPGRQR